MPLPNLLNVPKNKQEWDIWEWSHREHHDLLRQEIQRQSNGADNLFQYQLSPISPDQVQEFLSRNQQSHDDFNAVLGIQGVDLEGADFKDQKQLTAWILANYQEHFNAAQALAI